MPGWRIHPPASEKMEGRGECTLLEPRDNAVSVERPQSWLATMLIPLAELERRTRLHLSPSEWLLLFQRAGFTSGEPIDLRAMRARNELSWWDDTLLLVGGIHAIRKHNNAKDLIILIVHAPTSERQKHQVLTTTRSLVYFKGRPRWFLPKLRVPYAAVKARIMDANSDRRPRPIVRMHRERFRKASSYGMVCSECEVGLSDFHDDIFFVPSEVRPGTSLGACLGDYVLRLLFPMDQHKLLSLSHISRRLRAAHKAQ
jgi:tRNA-binding EMAP/Myf-like protein